MKSILSTLLIVFSLSFSFGQQSTTAKQEIDNYLSSKGDIHLNYEIITDNYDKNSGLWKIQALQLINGVKYNEGILLISKGFYSKNHVIDDFIRKIPSSSSPSITPKIAVEKTLAYHNVPLTSKLESNFNSRDNSQEFQFDKLSSTSSDINARLLYIKDDKNGEVRLTWQTRFHTLDQQNFWVTYIDPISGRIIKAVDLVVHCDFGGGLVYDASPSEQKVLDEEHKQFHIKHAVPHNILKRDVHQHSENCSHEAAAMVATTNSYLVLDMPAEAPNDTLGTVYTQTTVVTAGDPIASPYGWTSNDNVTQNTHSKGNNVWAFHDPSVGPLGGAPNPVTGAKNTDIDPMTMDQEFIYPWDLTKEPEYSTVDPNNQFPNRNAAIVNLFYWNNIIHDVFYHFGFTEAGRNFQFDNMSKGGVGNDEVLAQAQDGGGTNNANFLTLADGANGQMQMYLWTSSSLDSIVQITSVSLPTSVKDGDKFASVQGALYSSAAPINLNTNPVIDKEYVLVNDGCGSPKGCGAGSGVGLPPCNTVTNKIVLIDRGICSFVEKVHGAQLGGAAGVIVMNNDASNPDAILSMGGSDATVNTITIPSVMVSYNSGLLLKQAMASGAIIIGSLIQENPPTPKRDGDFDNGIIAHEYGHGITSRFSPQTATGGSLSGSEQGGEGWADYIALYLTTTISDLETGVPAHPSGKLPARGIGTYVQYDQITGAGIRPRKYSIDESINEYTFTGETNGGFGITNAAEITIPHGVGFIWCTMLYEFTQLLIDEYGFTDDKYYYPPSTGNLMADTADIYANNGGNNLALKLILEGIANQASSPSFTDMRDGILTADTLLYGGIHSCVLWEAFAKRGLGVNAVNLSNKHGDEQDGYATPCDSSQIFFDIDKTAVSQATNRSVITYTIEVANTTIGNSTAYAVDVIDVMPPNSTFIDAGGAPYVVSNDSVIYTIDSILAQETKALTLKLFINLPEATNILSTFDFESGEQGWTPLTGGFNSFEYIDDDAANSHSGTAHFFTPNLGLTGANTMLTSPTLDTSIVGKQIRFWHKFDTDAGYDGGFLETTADGATWTRLPVQLNGYNGALSSTYNPANAGSAYTGTVVGYIESAASLPNDAIQVRFVFSEDAGSGGGDGWWIDDILIVSSAKEVINTAYVTDPIMSGGRVHSNGATTLIVTELPDNPCRNVNTLNDAGVGSLPFAIGCATEGDTIYFDTSIHGDTIVLAANQALVNKSLVIESEVMDNITVQGTSVGETFKIIADKDVVIRGLKIIGGNASEGNTIYNSGNLILENVTIIESGVGSSIYILTGGQLTIKSTTVTKE